jgi:predicted nuclease of predicted toxin-antitoxin system
MKFLVDMNLSPRWTALLTDAGWEAVHWSKAGKSTASDSEIVAYAAINDYVVITHDLDFSAILAATHGEKPSVVQIRAEDVGPLVIGPHLIAALRHTETELEAGALLTVDPSRTRVRLLPLKIVDES